MAARRQSAGEKRFRALARDFVLTNAQWCDSFARGRSSPDTARLWDAKQKIERELVALMVKHSISAIAVPPDSVLVLEEFPFDRPATDGRRHYLRDCFLTSLTSAARRCGPDLDPPAPAVSQAKPEPAIADEPPIPEFLRAGAGEGA